MLVAMLKGTAKCLKLSYYTLWIALRIHEINALLLGTHSDLLTFKIQNHIFGWQNPLKIDSVFPRWRKLCVSLIECSKVENFVNYWFSVLTKWHLHHFLHKKSFLKYLFIIQGMTGPPGLCGKPGPAGFPVSFSNFLSQENIVINNSTVMRLVIECKKHFTLEWKSFPTLT